MLTEKQKNELLKFGLRVKFDVPVGKYTYFKVGGSADAFIRFGSFDALGDIMKVLDYCCEQKILVTVIGGGSNLLIADAGLNGLVIQLFGKIVVNYLKEKDFSEIFVSAGTSMKTLVDFTIENELTGLEPFYGLPGTVGGAIYNNSHFKYNQLFGNFVKFVSVLPLSGGGIILEFPRESLDFSYDHSMFQGLTDKLLILGTVLRLNRGEKSSITRKARRVMEERKLSQPFDVPSSGCIFKNPSRNLSSSFLIDKAGFKGFRIGGGSYFAKTCKFYRES